MKEEHLEKLILILPYIKRERSIYFQVDGYIQLLDQFIEGKLEIADLILLPFYITNELTYELYDYEFNIRLTKTPNVESFFLTKTGKKTLEEIDKSILEKLRHCYFEINPVDKRDFIKILRQYFEYLTRNDDIRQRVKDNFGGYSSKNLYFEIY